jgi:hypothetical protein
VFAHPVARADVAQVQVRARKRSTLDGRLNWHRSLIPGHPTQGPSPPGTFNLETSHRHLRRSPVNGPYGPAGSMRRSIRGSCGRGAVRLEGRGRRPRRVHRVVVVVAGLCSTSGLEVEHDSQQPATDLPDELGRICETVTLRPARMGDDSSGGLSITTMSAHAGSLRKRRRQVHRGCRLPFRCLGRRHQDDLHWIVHAGELDGRAQLPE